MQLPLFLVLFLGLVTAPYAHTCLPDTSGNSELAAGSGDSDAQPCRGDTNRHPPGHEKKECCQLEISDCLHGAELITLAQGYSQSELQDHDAIPADTAPYSVLAIRQVVPRTYNATPASTLHDQHTYLVTLRLRI